MKHWEKASPRAISTIDYESVVANKDEAVKQLRSIAGINAETSANLDEAANRNIITSSAWQVRQPVYSSARDHWRNYEKHLGPLFDAFERHGVKLPE